jgi:lysophospholipase L1-like esterase
MSDTPRNLTIAILASLFLLLVAGGGFLLGRHSAPSVKIDELVDEFVESTSFSRAYELVDQEINTRAFKQEPTPRELDAYLGTAMFVPAPFVNHIPAPGDQRNAHFNGWGFRHDGRIGPKPENVFRIFLCGGSTAYSPGAPSPETTLGGYLQDFLNRDGGDTRYEVVTAATPAWASTHERILIENVVSEMDPDLVISFSGNNDAHWGIAKENVFWFWSYYDKLLMQVLGTLAPELAESDITRTCCGPREAVPPETVNYRLMKNVRLAAHALKLKDVNYAFFLQPNRSVSLQQTGQSEGSYFSSCYALFREGFRKMDMDNFHFHDLSTMFVKDLDLYYVDDYHFADRGNEVIARRMAAHLRKAGLL